MRTRSPIPQPHFRRLGWGVRFALTFFGLTALAAGLIASSLSSSGSWWVWFWGFWFGAFVLGCLYLAVSGRNPFWRLDALAHEQRLESQNRLAEMAKSPLPEGWLRRLVPYSLLWSGLLMLPALVRGGALTSGWDGLILGTGMLLAVFWYCALVQISTVYDWFGFAGRGVHAVLLAILVVIAQVWAGGPLQSDLGWFAGAAFVVGLFAKDWTRGI